MNDPLVALGVAIPLVVALAGAIWWSVASARRDRRRQVAADYATRYQVAPRLLGHHEPTTHLFRGQGDARTVAEMLEEAGECGDGIRLNWPDEDVDEVGRVRPYAQDQFPTTILPKIADCATHDNEG